VAELGREKSARRAHIALTRRSSAFSRSSARIRAASAVDVPGRIPRSICACLAQPRSVSALIPSSAPTFRQAAVTVVWLNEAQFYLDPAEARLGERVAAGLRELLRDPGRAQY
jgi:hypothetical protein